MRRVEGICKHPHPRRPAGLEAVRIRRSRASAARARGPCDLYPVLGAKGRPARPCPGFSPALAWSGTMPERRIGLGFAASSPRFRRLDGLSTMPDEVAGLQPPAPALRGGSAGIRALIPEARALDHTCAQKSSFICIHYETQLAIPACETCGSAHRPNHQPHSRNTVPTHAPPKLEAGFPLARE